MTDKLFVDMNILIYAYDRHAGAKHQQAAELIRQIWENGGGVLSTQVLQEFYVNVTQKIPKPISFATARGLIDAYRAWQVEVNTRRNRAPGVRVPGAASAVVLGRHDRGLSSTGRSRRAVDRRPERRPIHRRR